MTIIPIKKKPCPCCKAKGDDIVIATSGTPSMGLQEQIDPKAKVIPYGAKLKAIQLLTRELICRKCGCVFAEIINETETFGITQPKTSVGAQSGHQVPPGAPGAPGLTLPDSWKKQGQGVANPKSGK